MDKGKKRRRCNCRFRFFLFPALIIPLVLVPPACASYMLLRAGEHTVDQLLPKLLRSSLVAVVERVHARIVSAQEITELRSKMWNHGLLENCLPFPSIPQTDPPSDPPTGLSAHLHNALVFAEQYPQFAWVYFDYQVAPGLWMECGCGNGDLQELYWFEMYNETQYYSHHLEQTYDAITISGEISYREAYDPLEQSWVQWGLAGNIGWTPISIWTEPGFPPTPLATYTQPVFNASTNNSEIIGLFNCDLSMGFIEQELSAGRVPSSDIIVFDLVALAFIGSTRATPVAGVDDTTPYRATSTQDQLVNSIAAYLIGEYDSLDKVPDGLTQLSVPLGNGLKQDDYVLSVTIYNRTAMHWMYCQVIPRNAWLRPVTSAFRQALAVTIATAVGVAAIICTLAALISTQLHRLSRAMEHVAALRLDKALPKTSVLRELQGVTSKFEAMVNALREVRAYIPQAVLDQLLALDENFYTSGSSRSHTPTGDEAAEPELPENENNENSAVSVTSVAVARPRRESASSHSSAGSSSAASSARYRSAPTHPTGRQLPGAAFRSQRCAVLYCNVQGTYNLCDSATAAADVIASAAERVWQASHAHRGTALYFTGDRFAVVFTGSEPETRAVHAAMAVTTNSEPQSSSMFYAEGNVPVTLRAAVATSTTWMGRMGCTHWLTYNCLGPAINVAVALEGLNKRTGTRLLIDDSTFQAAQYHFKCLPVTLAAFSKLLKHRERPAPVYWVLRSLNRAAGEEWMYELNSNEFEDWRSELFLRAFDHFTKQRFVEVQALLAKGSTAGELFPDNPQVCEYLRRLSAAGEAHETFDM
eukprot:TRINITY_DN7021_c0_g1_i1.p1 TRINITY_DN7021_c0_g1~~TRINITY_DN7021_c0_g1_i1.p1  ORF type:complete len:816 (+),score=89.38 TRINITY_DN7021_c0_g1_i1:131-2578(+)